MSREARHRALQRVFWSRLGLPFVRAYTAFSRRWEYVVMNRSLLPECNGEYWLLSLLPPAPLVLDVGLNVGEFTREALRQRPRARVVGFEPARSMQRECATSLGTESRLELLPMAVSNERAVMEFHDSADGSSTLLGGRQTVGETYWVETVTLDDFADERGYTKIHLVKIDVEGYDLHVLEGARRLLARQAIEIFSFEYNEPWINSRRFLKDACDYLADTPYVLFRLFNGFLAPFRYTHRAERHDLGRIYVGVSRRRLDCGDIPVREFPQ
jgi:FkbM family methyltransferase